MKNYARSFTYAGALLTLCAGLTGCFGDSPEQSLAKAKAAIARNDTKTAVIELKNALQKDAKLGEARFLLGKTLLESGDIGGGVIEIGKARDAGYDAEQVAALMAGAMFKQHAYDRLISTYGETELKNPKLNAELKAALAGALAFKGRLEQARSSADLALSQDSDNVNAGMINVRLLAAAGNVDAAKQALELLLKNHPKHSEGWVLKAELLRDPAQQLVALREALAQDKANASAHAAIIAMMLRQKDFDAARQQLAAMKAAAPKNPQTFYYGALLALESKDVKRASEEIAPLMRSAPDSPMILQLAGAIDLQRGAYEQAVANLTKVVQAQPEAVAARLSLAQAYARSGNVEKAEATLKPLLEKKEVPFEVYGAAAEIKMQQGKVKEAKELYEKVLKLNPTNPRGRTMLALVSVDEGRTSQGIEELESIAASDTSFTADLALIRLHLSKGEMDKALVAIEKLGAKPKAKPLALSMRGNLELKQGDKAKARASFEAAVKDRPDFMPAVNALANLDLADKQVDSAVGRFTSVLKADPSNVVATMSIIRMRAAAGMGFSDLQALIQDAIKRHPGEPAPRAALIQLRLRNGQPKDAVVAAQEATAAFADSAEMQDLLGQAQVGAGDLNQAVKAFVEMASLQPKSPLPALRLASVEVARNAPDAAITQLKRALGISADYLPAQTMLVDLLLGKKDWAGANALARTIQQQRPTDPMGWAVAGDIAVAQREFPTAIAAFRASLGKRETTDVAIKLMRVWRGLGKTGEADAFEKDWLARHVNDARFQFFLSDAALAAGNFALAEKYGLAVLGLEPNNAIVLNNLAWLAHVQNKPGAVEYAERALKLMPDSPPILDTLASIYADGGNSAKALETQKRAVMLDPNRNDHRLRLAKYYAAAGQKAEARVELKRLKDLGDKFPMQAEVGKLLANL